MKADVMRPAFDLKLKYRVTILTRKEWISRPGTLIAVKGLVWFADGSRPPEETGTAVFGQSLGRRLSICLGKTSEVTVSALW
jgi:hypothetical protein